MKGSPIISNEREARMVIAHKQGCRKAHLGFQLEYIESLSTLLPTADERMAFIAGFKGEQQRIKEKT